jgi:broad specificity phosphatase PhoE
MTTFYIVRHAQTKFNIQEIMQGNTTDSPLTARGKDQAQQIAQELAHIHFDKVFSSDLARARRTAEIIVLEKKLAVKTTQALREQNYGTYEGRKIKKYLSELKEILNTYESLQDEEKMHFRIQSDFETDAEVVSRFITFLREIAVAYPDKTILIVSHGDAIKYFLIHTGFATYTELPYDAIENCSWVKVESDGVDFSVKETRGIQIKGK